MNFDAPSLDNLNDFVLKGHQQIDPEEKNTIQYLYKDAQKYGHFWLYGQLKMAPSDPITYEKIEESIAINTQRLQEYGGPCNAMEMHSIADHEKKITFLRSTIEKYYQYQYAPPNKTIPYGGEIYQYLAKITNIGK
jgi:hypothetical protein